MWFTKTNAIRLSVQQGAVEGHGVNPMVFNAAFAVFAFRAYFGAYIGFNREAVGQKPGSDVIVEDGLRALTGYAQGIDVRIRSAGVPNDGDATGWIQAKGLNILVEGFARSRTQIHGIGREVDAVQFHKRTDAWRPRKWWIVSRNRKGWRNRSGWRSHIGLASQTSPESTHDEGRIVRIVIALVSPHIVQIPSVTGFCEHGPALIEGNVHTDPQRKVIHRSLRTRYTAAGEVYIVFAVTVEKVCRCGAKTGKNIGEDAAFRTRTKGHDDLRLEHENVAGQEGIFARSHQFTSVFGAEVGKQDHSAKEEQVPFQRERPQENDGRVVFTNKIGSAARLKQVDGTMVREKSCRHAQVSLRIPELIALGLYGGHGRYEE